MNMKAKKNLITENKKRYNFFERHNGRWPNSGDNMCSLTLIIMVADLPGVFVNRNISSLIRDGK